MRGAGVSMICLLNSAKNSRLPCSSSRTTWLWFRKSPSIGVMYAGSTVEMGKASEVFLRPLHPYTRGLLNSVPTLRSDRTKPLQIIEGSVPAIAAQPPGCAFEPRCASRIASCEDALPPLVEGSPGHLARCPITAQEVR